MGPIPLAAHVVNQQAPVAWQRHRPSEVMRLVPKLVDLARLAPGVFELLIIMQRNGQKRDKNKSKEKNGMKKVPPPPPFNFCVKSFDMDFSMDFSKSFL
jgi:hypothetical protein